MVKKSELQGLILVLGTAIISGFSIFINKFGVGGIDPYLFTGAKNLLVAVFLFSLLVASRRSKTLSRLTPKDWLNLFLIGLFGGSLPFLLFFQGLSQTTAAQASFIHKNMFVFVALLALFFLKEKLEKSFLVAAFFLLLGNLFLLNRTLGLSWNKGSSLILLATFLWAGETILSKKTLKKLSPSAVAFGRMFFGSLMIIVYLGLTGRLSQGTGLSLSQMLWIGLTSLFLLAYVSTWYQGLKRLKASLAASILTLGSPITSFLSLFSGTPLELSQITGVVFLFLGISFLIGSQKLSSLLRYLFKPLYARS